MSKLSILIVSLASSTVVLLLSVLYQKDWGLTLTLLLQVVPVLMMQDRLNKPRWFSPVWSAWCGGSFLAAWWLQLSEGLQPNPVFVSFGPGYLVISLLALVWPKQFNN